MKPAAFCRLTGVISPADWPLENREPPAGHRLEAVARGWITHSPEAVIHTEDGSVCIAFGAPRFLDSELARTHETRNAAAAWLDAFRQHGLHAPTLAHGRFSVVMHDSRSHETWLVTDRFATWPLCFAEHQGQLCFADRADAVPEVRATLAPQAIFDYLYFHMIPAPQTVFAGVNRVPAGHVLHASSHGLECTRWWNPYFDENHHPDLEHSKQRFMALVEQSVAREAETWKGIGCFLSGGTDSSTVAGMLCRILGEPVRGYSIGFDASGYDEMAYARLAANHFGVDHRDYYVTPDDLLEAIPVVAGHYDQPFGNSSAAPAWICARRARADGVEKMLAGDGGDELFGGNTRYAKQRVFGWYEHVPEPFRRYGLEPIFGLPGMRSLPFLSKGASYIEQARVPMPDRLQMYNMLNRLGPNTLFTPDFLARINPGHPLQLQRETWNAVDAKALVNRMLAWDWKYTLADNDLPKVIGTTQLAGVEVGFPFLSDELLEFSLSLPPEWKLKGLTLRWFFKESLRGFLPDEIIAKKKHGFGLPFGVWVGQHPGLKKLADDSLASLARRNIVRGEFIDDLTQKLLPSHPGYYGEMVWILMMLELWLRAHGDPDFG